MRRTRALSLLPIVPLVLLTLACSDPPAEEDASAETEKDSLLSKLGDHERKLRALPGRKGILAEEKRYSLFDEELIIRDFFQDRRDGVFLDVGCAWPIGASNTSPRALSARSENCRRRALSSSGGLENPMSQRV